MKKQIILLILLLICLSSYSQKRFVRKTTTPRTDAMIDTIVGKWIDPPNNLEKEMNKVQALEVAKRLNAINKISMDAYPAPTSAAVRWGGSLVKTSFANQVKYVITQNGKTEEEIEKYYPVSRLQYNLILYPYFCSNSSANEILNVFPDISGGNGITIYANELSILTGNILQEEGMAIDGQPIKYKMPTMGKWKGYDMMTPEGGANATSFSKRYILISRNGMLPYIPVTRKQYLDRAILYAVKFYDKLIAGGSLATDKTEKDKYIKINKDAKNNALKKYQDELEKTTNEGLLEAPAIVQFFCSPLQNNEEKIFVDEKEGSMVLIENADYMRGCLPNYVPQFFVVKWRWEQWKATADLAKLIEERFPFEKLQAMIDK